MVIAVEAGRREIFDAILAAIHFCFFVLDGRASTPIVRERPLTIAAPPALGFDQSCAQALLVSRTLGHPAHSGDRE
jgi:hypothetical protein